MIPQAVILLGGKGTRIAERYPDRPKCLVPVAGRPFLEWQLDWLKRNGVERILLAGGHKADILEAYLFARARDGLVVSLSREPRPLGTGGALKFVEKLLASDPLLVLNGDSLVPHLDLSRAWSADEGPVQPDRRRNPADASGEFSTPWTTFSEFFHAMENFFPRCGKLFVAPIEDPGRYGTVESDGDHFVTAFREKAERTAGFVNAGLYLLPREIVAAIPADRPVSLETDVFPSLAAQKRLLALPCPPPLLDMGTPEGLAAMEAFLTK